MAAERYVCMCLRGDTYETKGFAVVQQRQLSQDLCVGHLHPAAQTSQGLAGGQFPFKAEQGRLVRVIDPGYRPQFSRRGTYKVDVTSRPP
jgi:hypothetical protein